jgi:hypothetical protein
MLATANTVPAAKWLGTRTKPDPNDSTKTVGLGSGDVQAALTAAHTSGTQADADLAIGILAMDLVDKNRATLRPLPYQHFGQSCGFLPDSTAESFDKQNTRDGHYMVWGPLHMLAHVTTAGVPTNAGAKLVIDYLSGAVVPAFDLIKTEAGLGVVPDCAMRVSRSSEVGPLSSYMPAHSCECKFVTAATGTAPDSCQSCATPSDCPSAAPACNYGFCEVR